MPIANEADAEATCLSVIPHVEAGGTEVVVVHVIERTEGSIDKAPLEARREEAGRIFDTVRREFVAAGLDVETALVYDPAVAEAVLATADDLDASAIVLTPRGGPGVRDRLLSALSGDAAYKLLKNDRHPVVVFPRTPNPNPEGR